MQRHIILVLEGGGAKIPLPLGMLEELEENLKTVEPVRPDYKLSHHIDCLVSTSAGSVISSVLSLGQWDCKKISFEILQVLPRIFRRQHLVKSPLYDKEEYVRLYKSRVSRTATMSDAVPKTLITAVNMCDGRTHFFKSWEEKDGKLSMPEAAKRSFSAPYYFGPTIDKQGKAVWMDGGVGVYNLPLTEAYVEACRQGWLAEGHQTHILALGCGQRKLGVPFKEASSRRWIRRLARSLKFFFNLRDGGRARAQSSIAQVNAIKAIASRVDNLSFQWVTWEDMPEDLDEMDNIDAMMTYYKKGRELGRTINTQPFVSQ